MYKALLLSCPSSPNLVICLARLLHSGEPSHQQLPDLPGCIHFREVGISVGAAWSALRSRIHRLYLLYQHSPIYSCWFCCGPYPCTESKTNMVNVIMITNLLQYYLESIHRINRDTVKPVFNSGHLSIAANLPIVTTKLIPMETHYLYKNLYIAATCL